MKVYSIPKATLGRLPGYLQYLKEIDPSQYKTISATAIARAMSLGEVQVRKDLALVSGAGKPKIGYDTDKLISDIEARLGHEGLTGAVLVGAGKLGRALLDYDGFEEFGVRIIAGFDCNERVIKRESAAKSILPIAELEGFCRERDVRLGIITVGQGSAQEVCDRLVASGIKAIWNFAPCSLTVPEGIILHRESLALSLAHLNNQLSK